MAAMISCASSGSAGRRAAASSGGRSLAMGWHEATDSRRKRVRERRETRGTCAIRSATMTRAAKIANLLTVVLPPLVIIAAIVVFWNEVVGVHDLLVALLMY